MEREHQNAAAILQINASINKKPDCSFHHNLLRRKEDVCELKLEKNKTKLEVLGNHPRDGENQFRENKWNRMQKNTVKTVSRTIVK